MVEEYEEKVFVYITMDIEYGFELLLELVMKATTFMALVFDKNMETFRAGFDILIKSHGK